MTFTVKHQETYSRGELLLRSFFGYFYIVLPHAFLLMFLGLWGSILSFISWLIIMFTGSYPENFFEYQVKLMKWSTRVNLRIYNLADGYPAFGLESEDPAFSLDVPYPENLSRATQLLKLLFGAIYVIIPHGFLLLFRGIATMFLWMLGWWVVLFTGKFPESWHEFIVGTMRWGLRVQLYMGYMTDDYPPFSGK
ncbi:MAG: DUF4389 domain-containing protein [Reichenbachiella sp.]|uniref:DUF4389 domain-containing protein n=1 Tax=Reichenbachiella sp. TaxID=2184521 RepID=UPI0029660C03|nr:DUF4389 domain-containing protein [Reichenbachiella sp.]MDW3211034.1 DUF4389 domain-containing protein [Reichenbachiella sp.]